MAADSLPPGPPVLEQIVPAPGETLEELRVIEVQFDRKVIGLRTADLLINGLAATNVSETVQGHFLFEFSPAPEGPVTVSWDPANRIVDENNERFAGDTWSYTVDSSVAPQPMISEFMAANKKTIRDADGDNSDWIEIYNPDSKEANLEGWFLSNSQADLAMWQFPAVSIAANSYLVVFASAKNRTDPSGQLHTNFKLSPAGGFLALSSPLTNLVSAFAPSYPAQLADVSYGRAVDSFQSLGFFIKPTPGRPNSTGGPGFAPDVEFSSVSGPFTNAFALTLTTASTSAVIRYTMNGMLPTNSSPVYSGPIAITNSLQIRARAYDAGVFPGQPRSETFLFTPGVQTFTSTLPVMVIQTFGKFPSSSLKTPSQITVFEPVNGVASLTNAPALATRGSVKLRGSSTLGLPKASFALELWDEFDQGQNLPLLKLPAESDWVLYAPDIYEPVMIHNPFVYQMSQDMGMYSPRTRFVELFLQTRVGTVVSNSYNGIYVLEEKIKVGKDRVNIDKLQPQNLKEPEVTGGYLLKIDRLGPGESGLPAAGTTVVYVEPKEIEIKQAARKPQDQYIRGYFAKFSTALNSTNWRDPNTGYAAFIDQPSWIDYHLLETLSGNVDALVLSAYFHKPREGKLTFGPHWDFDRALGSTDGRDSNPRMWGTGPFFTAPWWSRILGDKDFWQTWVDRYQELRPTVFSKAHMEQLIDRLANELREAQPRETKKWATGLRGGTYQSEIDLMKNWLSNRLDFIDRQLTQPPRISRPGGPTLAESLVEFTAQTNATVYYTLDGTDPRLPQGDISPNALVYSTPIVIQGNARVFARARNPSQRQFGGPPASTPWSGPVTASFYAKVPALLISELMVYPEAPLPAGSYAADDYEFIELKNPGPDVLNLIGLSVAGSVSFKFSGQSPITNLNPGERLLLVKNKIAFLSRYPNAANIGGEFAGNLAGAGFQIALAGALGEPILDLSYADKTQKFAREPGFSLVLSSESIAPDQFENLESWRPSSQAGGSPGVADPAPPIVPQVRVSEILSNPKHGGHDTIELYNPSAGVADISGWFLSDNFQSPFKYKIPAQTFIPGKGFLVFTDAQFHGSPSGFSLSSSGDQAFLFAADNAGRLLGYYHGFSFGAAEPGVSFGLFTTSDGIEHLAPQTGNSFGLPNGYPRSGPIVVREIFYNPGSDFPTGQFIELLNITDSPVPLFDPEHPGNTWKVDGGVQFDFPPSVVVPAHGLITLTGFNPVNEYFASPFRSRYGSRRDARLFGPWTGSLATNSDVIELLRPLAFGTNSPPNPLPYVAVDAVHFTDRSGWPAAGSLPGYSITRINPSFFGDEPSNWQATLPSPGTEDSDGDGLPDAWEVENGLNPRSSAGQDGPAGDPDGDGFSNYAEFLAGTSPRQADSFLELNVSVSPAHEALLSFSPVVGRSYTLMFTDNPGVNPWQVLRSFPVTSTADPIVFKDKLNKTLRFYRLQVP